MEEENPIWKEPRLRLCVIETIRAVETHCNRSFLDLWNGRMKDKNARQRNRLVIANSCRSRFLCWTVTRLCSDLSRFSGLDLELTLRKRRWQERCPSWKVDRVLANQRLNLTAANLSLEPQLMMSAGTFVGVLHLASFSFSFCLMDSSRFRQLLRHKNERERRSKITN